MDKWNPEQYSKFSNERSKPFWDLAELVRNPFHKKVLDIGCGTGELTIALHQKWGSELTLGIDSSAKMLTKAAERKENNVTFLNANVETFSPSEKYEVIFSNAALQWVHDHTLLLKKTFQWLTEDGQIALQMPANFDHPSHFLAKDIAIKLFPDKFSKSDFLVSVEPVEMYSKLFYECGFRDQNCFIKVYGHPMKSGTDVIEWVKGTTLTKIESKLSPREFDKFLQHYSEELLAIIGEGPYFYTFKRMLLWAEK